jgi:hypothetical protein
MDCCLSGHLFHVVFLAPYRRRGLVLGSVRHIKILSSLDFFGRPLIFGLWLYLDELQFKFEFRSG